MLVIERPLSSQKGIRELARELKSALTAHGVGTEDKQVVVKVSLTDVGDDAKMAKVAAFDPRAAGLALVQKLKESEGGSWSGRELNERFGLTSATLHGRRKMRRIVFWRDAKHDFFYPQWQFTEAGAMRPGIEDILKVFNSTDEWRVMRYFLSPRRQLEGKKPLDLLRSGEVEKVISHAQNNAAEGSW